MPIELTEDEWQTKRAALLCHASQLVFRRRWMLAQISHGEAFDNHETHPRRALPHPVGNFALQGGKLARISLRLPESLKTSVERAAEREGISVNAWLVRAVAQALSFRTACARRDTLRDAVLSGTTPC